jgi:hypothetical protein
MRKTLLAVSHLRQRAEADCLPVCAQAPQTAPRHSFELSMLRFDSRCVILGV